MKALPLQKNWAEKENKKEESELFMNYHPRHSRLSDSLLKKQASTAAIEMSAEKAFLEENKAVPIQLEPFTHNSSIHEITFKDQEIAVKSPHKDTFDPFAVLQ